MGTTPSPPPPPETPILDSVALEPFGGTRVDSLAARSGYGIKMVALVWGHSGSLVQGLDLTWSASANDRFVDSSGYGFWTVNGQAEVHTLTVRVTEQPGLTASYHVWVFNKTPRLEIVGASLPAAMTVGDSTPIRARVLSADGAPIPGLAVWFLPELEGWIPCGQYGWCPRYAGWTEPAQGWVGGDRLWIRTDPSGVASGTFISDTLLTGRFNLTLTTGNVVSGSRAVASLVLATTTVRPGPASNISPAPGLGGQNQSGQVGSTLAYPFYALVTDRYGHPVANESVVWNVVEGGGSLVFASSRTDQYGHALARLVLGPEPGPQRVMASIGNGTSAIFTATATP